MKIVKADQKSFIRYGYYDEEGDFVTHSEDGPAVIYENGLKIWYNHDELHREAGPAVIYADGEERWCINGKNITDEIIQWLKDYNIDDWKTMTDEDKLALGFFMRSL